VSCASRSAGVKMSETRLHVVDARAELARKRLARAFASMMMMNIHTRATHNLFYHPLTSQQYHQNARPNTTNREICRSYCQMRS
jgi:hypothetical protein